MEKIAYLRKYSTDIKLVDIHSLSTEIRNTLPEYWNKVLLADNAESKKDLLLTGWRRYNYQYQSTIHYMSINLVDVELIFNNNNYSLLYSIKDESGEIAFYEGKNPLTKKRPENIASLWHKLPKTFTDFYDNLHNGWVYFASQSMGVLPIEDVIVLGDLDWGILDEIDVNSLPFNLANCIGFFHNGMGDYASIDLESKDKNSGFIWWHTKAPKLNIEIWPVIDQWTKIGIEK